MYPFISYTQTSHDQLPDGVSLDQRLGDRVPLDLIFTDSTGQSRRLGDYFTERPVALVLGYYECPNLCGLVMNAASASFAALTFKPAKDYDLVFVSIDPTETPRLAAASKRAHTRHYGKPGAAEGWHFLTGQASSIKSLAEAVGFRYQYDESTGQYAHPSGILLLTPDGVLSKYFYGIEIDPSDLRLGLVEASAGNIGSAVDQLLLLCFHYNPVTGKYGLLIDRVIKTAGSATVIGLGVLVGSLLWRERHKRRTRVEN